MQPLPSSQVCPPLPTQVPPEQMSLVVHALLSLHAAALLALTQPLIGSQLSSVHRFLSSQLTPVPPGMHLPPLQLSPVVQTLLSSQFAALLA